MATLESVIAQGITQTRVCPLSTFHPLWTLPSTFPFAIIFWHLPRIQAWADDRTNIAKMYKFWYFITKLFHYHENCVRISTNMPSIGLVICEIDIEMWIKQIDRWSMKPMWLYLKGTLWTRGAGKPAKTRGIITRGAGKNAFANSWLSPD